VKIGIIGFPRTGKTTVFNALTRSEIPTEKFAGRSTKTNIGVAKVRDERLGTLTEMHHPKKITPATVEYVDLPGFEKGKGAPAAYLNEFKGLDALLHVVRGFEDADIPHAFPTIDPARDIAALETELLLVDMAATETRIARIEADLRKKKDPQAEAELALVKRFASVLEAERPLRAESWDEEQLQRVRGMAFLTLKPVLHVVNLPDTAAGKDPLEGMGLDRFASTPRTGVTFLMGKAEEEISRLSPEDARAFLEDLGLAEATADRVAAASYALLDLVSFLTAGEPEVRAWPIPRGTTARKAAGRIHSDIERGFIRAEVVAFADLVAAGSSNAAKDRGLLRLEGKDYIVQDGDVIMFRFNV